MSCLTKTSHICSLLRPAGESTTGAGTLDADSLVVCCDRSARKVIALAELCDEMRVPSTLAHGVLIDSRFAAGDGEGVGQSSRGSEGLSDSQGVASHQRIRDVLSQAPLLERGGEGSGVKAFRFEGESKGEGKSGKGAAGGKRGRTRTLPRESFDCVLVDGPCSAIGLRYAPTEHHARNLLLPPPVPHPHPGPGCAWIRPRPT